MTSTAEETCKYTRDMCAELAALCANAGLSVLSYTLSMAQLEAASQLLEIQSAPIVGMPVWDGSQISQEVATAVLINTASG
jgi:exo-beta-1,3-glucanase (GH17 family)